MITLYLWDSLGWYSGTTEAAETEALPARSTTTPPPASDGDAVPFWAGFGWELRTPSGTAAPPVLPTVVVVAVAVEGDAGRARISEDFSTMKLPVGAIVRVTAELQIGGALLEGFNGEFAMPLRSTDGVLRYLDVVFTDGVAQFSATMTDSKRWIANEELINSELPPEAWMHFTGMVITAVE